MFYDEDEDDNGADSAPDPLETGEYNTLGDDLTRAGDGKDPIEDEIL